MDPFTQRMLERARARQEKIDQKLASTGQTPKRKPLGENIANIKTMISPIKSPVKDSPKKTTRDSLKSATPTKSPNRKISMKSNFSPQLNLINECSSPRRNDVVVTKKEFDSAKLSGDSNRNSDVSVEINIMHRDDIQIEVQVEEREVPMSVVYGINPGTCATEAEIKKDSPKKMMCSKQVTDKEPSSALRHNVKSRLDRLGILYSDKAELSSPIHRTELEFTCATPPQEGAAVTPRQPPKEGKRKFGRLAALADQINNWEDDLTHHNAYPESSDKGLKIMHELESSTLDVSIHSLNDINKAVSSNKSKQQKQTAREINTHTFTKSTPTSTGQHLDQKTVADLERAGYRRVSASQSRLVYDFSTPKITDHNRQEPKGATTLGSPARSANMATMVAASPPTKPAIIAKKPSIKKYKAPTPPQKKIENSDSVNNSDKDKENNVIEQNENTTTTQVDDNNKNSPVVKRLAPKLNGNVDRNSVLSKAAMFEAGSPRAKDPAEMSLRERKALFEKNKGTVILPKAPFGMAPPLKSLHGEQKEAKPLRPQLSKSSDSSKTASPSLTPTRSTSSNASSKENLEIDSQNPSGIRGKLAALLNKEQTISETTISNKFKLERDREMEMLQNRFHYKPKQTDSDDEDHVQGEHAPLMGSQTSLAQALRKPEIISNIPKVTFDKEQHQPRIETDGIVSSQPNKKRSSQDSPVVLAVLDDVKRIKVNNKQPTTAPSGIYPHLSDIETDTSNTQEEFSECGGSSSENIEDDVKDDCKMNKSDNWAETSFGREVMQVVKKNNTSYKKAIEGSEADTDTSESDMNSELDDFLDEALNHDDSEGPTPPKLNKHGNTLSSKSFTYEQGSPVRKQFKSPLKAGPLSTPRADRGNELVHSVSFYRRMQNASSNPSTPMRVVRHTSPERASEDPQPAVTVRQRVKELQAEVTKQQTIISQASQALNLCASTIEFSGSTEQAEGERLLLLASDSGYPLRRTLMTPYLDADLGTPEAYYYDIHVKTRNTVERCIGVLKQRFRRQACLHEIQRLQVEGAGEAAEEGMAALHIDGITLPLKRDYIRQINAEGAVGHHAVCLVKCRDRVLATSMQQTRPSAHLLHFPDDIRMEGVSSDFNVTVEIYLLQASKELLPHDVKYHISNKKCTSKLLTPKGKASSLKTPQVQSPGGPHAVRTPQFQGHGYCIFALQQANRTHFTLNKVPPSSPLEGSISLKISARVRVPAPAPHSAFLTAFDDVSGLGAWHRRWFLLQPPTMTYWKYPDDVNKKMPIGDIDLTTVVSEKAVRAPRDLCARPNTILLETSVPAGLIVQDSGSLVYVRRPDGTVARRHLLSADTTQDRDLWIHSINKALEYVRCMPGDV